MVELNDVPPITTLNSKSWRDKVEAFAELPITVRAQATTAQTSFLN
jgi:hypothetical protein